MYDRLYIMENPPFNSLQHAKKYPNKVGMIHESKGQQIGKAPSLHLLHTTVGQHAWESSLNVPQVHNLYWQFMAVAHSQATFSSHMA